MQPPSDHRTHVRRRIEGSEMRNYYSVEKFADDVEMGKWKLPTRSNTGHTVLLDGRGILIIWFRTSGEMARFLDTTILELKRRRDIRLLDFYPIL